MYSSLAPTSNNPTSSTIDQEKRVYFCVLNDILPSLVPLNQSQHRQFMGVHDLGTARNALQAFHCSKELKSKLISLVNGIADDALIKRHTVKEIVQDLICTYIDEDKQERALFHTTQQIIAASNKGNMQL